MTQQHELDIRQWLVALSLRCAPRTTENIEVLAKDYAEGLSDLPYEAFTPQSREAAARNWEYFPSYKSLRKFLETWAEKHKPVDTLLLPPIEDPSLSDDDRAHVRFWIKHRSERQGNGKFAVTLDVLRKWPAAFAYICRTDAEAEAVARRHGWLRDEVPIDVSEPGITRNLIQLEQVSADGPVGVALASLGLSILVKAVTARAPERLHLLPASIKPPAQRHRSVAEQLEELGPIDAAREEVAKATADFMAKHDRKPGELSVEQLAAVRTAAGIHVPKPPSPPTIDSTATEEPANDAVDLWGLGTAAD